MYEHKGYVGVFEEDFSRRHVMGFVTMWLQQFSRIEQMVPRTNDVATLSVSKVEEIIWGEHLTFRLCEGPEFTWVYLSTGRRVIETTSFEGDGEQAALCLRVFEELEGILEVIDERNGSRLDELEEEGLL
ncbi:MAG: hypothetical protein SGI71_05335 [Verrucomicrobiota bacterium]|nr:hypothetical protein [Verrucomicrobiota bacterium]